MHWAAAGGHLDVVRRLADAGGDVIGEGDDHALDVIGWATCWKQCEDPGSETCARARRVAAFLVRRGARHHIYSAMGLGDADEVRRIVQRDPAALNRRMSRNEDHRLPLHFAVIAGRPDMVALLIELGADPLGTDGSGQPAALHATAPHVDRAVMEKIRTMTAAELRSAEGGHRPARLTMLDFAAAVALGDFELAGRLVRAVPNALSASGPGNGALHLMAKRNDVRGARWLLEHGAGVNALWPHWDANVVPLHLAAMQNQLDVARVLLDAGADVTIKDSQHGADPLEWAEFFKRNGMVELMKLKR
jgi:ankyrin repeat protein